MGGFLKLGLGMADAIISNMRQLKKKGQGL